jgi:hypothetical protein
VKNKELECTAEFPQLQKRGERGRRELDQRGGRVRGGKIMERA